MSEDEQEIPSKEQPENDHQYPHASQAWSTVHMRVSAFVITLCRSGIHIRRSMTNAYTGIGLDITDLKMSPVMSACTALVPPHPGQYR